MKRLSRTNQFKKDVKRLLKRGSDFTAFKFVIQQLLEAQELAVQYRDHALIRHTRAHANVTLPLIGR